METSTPKHLTKEEISLVLTSVFKMGLPNLNSDVHFMMKRKSFSVDCDNIACHTGSYHIFYTFDPNLVTCEECKKNLKKGV